MTRYYRKIIRIRAVDSPNVQLGIEQEEAGREPTFETVTPGVLSYHDYKKRRLTWDKVRQCIGLDAEFWEGMETLLFPPEWLNRAEEIAAQLERKSKVEGLRRKAKAIGIDPGEGVAKTCWSIIDEFGLIKLISIPTPDTAMIPAKTIALMQLYKVPAESVMFDRGGGGLQAADYLRQKGLQVRTVAFGESVTTPTKRGMTLFEEKRAAQEGRTTYKNRRVEMYDTLSLLLDPSMNETGFGVPAEYVELRQQLAVYPRLYDEEGKQILPPKSKKDANDKRITLTEMIGHSPDEADSLAIAVHCMVTRSTKTRAGVVE